MTKLKTHFSVESDALFAGILVGVVSAIFGLVFFWGVEPPLSGDGSIGLVAGLAAGIAVFALTYLSYGLSKTRKGQEWRLNLSTFEFIFDSTAVAIVHGFISTLLTWGAFLLLQRSFIGLTLDMWWAAVLIGVAAGVATHWAWLSASNISTTRMTTLLIIFLVVSMLSSMAAAPDEGWWRYHFSELGSFGTPSSWLFNISLILAGRLLVGFALYLRRDVKQLVDYGVLTNRLAPRFISGGFVIAGVALAGVGLFPVNVLLIPHKVSALILIVTVLLMMLGAGWLLKGLAWQTIALTYFFAALSVGSVLLFVPLGYFILTALEFVIFVLLFTWVAVFIRMLSAQLETVREERGNVG